MESLRFKNLKKLLAETHVIVNQGCEQFICLSVTSQVIRLYTEK